jgi:hypothetical protein
MIRSSLVALFALSLTACSSTPAPTTEAESDPLALTDVPTTAKPAAALPTAEPTAAPTTAPTSEPTAAPTAAPSTPPSSGRPPLLFSHSEKIANTFGASPAAKLELGSEGAVMRIPEYALRDTVNVVFALDKKPALNRKKKGGEGALYRLTGQRPPAEEAATVATDMAFELKLPVGKLTSPNLAVGEPKKDDKGRDTIGWTIVAPKKVEGGFAYFDLKSFTDASLQLTSEAPSAN